MPTISGSLETSKTSGKLYSVQVMRAFACIVVVLYHASLIMGEPQYGSILAFGRLFSKGWVGVNVFFIISGFIIMFAHSNDIGAPSRLGVYSWRRFSRVYPVYWIFLLAFMGAGVSGIGLGSYARNLPNYVTDFTLIQLVPAPSLPLKVAWTLMYEVSFYAMFSVLIISRRAGIGAMCGWLAVILFNNFIVHNYNMGWTSMWNTYFFFGVLAFVLQDKLHTKLGLPILILGVAVLTALIVTGQVFDRPDQAQYTDWNLILLAPPLTMIVLGATLWERAHAFDPPGIFVLIGEASYTIYLVHSSVISLACSLNYKFGHGQIPPKLLFVIIAVFAITIGVLAHLVVERPVTRVVRAILKTKIRQPSVARARAYS